MMSIGAALTAATTLVGTTLPVGLTGARIPVRTTRDDEAEEEPEASPPDGALLVAIEAGLREAGYLSA